MIFNKIYTLRSNTIFIFRKTRRRPPPPGINYGNYELLKLATHEI